MEANLCLPNHVDNYRIRNIRHFTKENLYFDKYKSIEKNPFLNYNYSFVILKINSEFFIVF